MADPMPEMPVPEVTPPSPPAPAAPPAFLHTSVPTPATDTKNLPEPATPNVLVEHDWQPKHTVTPGSKDDRPPPVEPIDEPVDPLKLKMSDRPVPHPRELAVVDIVFPPIPPGGPPHDPPRRT